MIKAFWILYALVILTGLFISAIRAYKEYIRYKHGKNNFGDLVKRLTDKGTDRETAIKLTQCRKTNALIRAIGYGAIAFVFNYIAIDILRQHIIGG